MYYKINIIWLKKILLFISLFLITINSSYACKIKFLWKEIPKTFKTNCYEKVWELNLTKFFWVDYCWYKTFLINSPEKIDTFIFNSKILPHKLFKNSGEQIEYKINLKWEQKYLSDNNWKTFLELDTNKNNEIFIEFSEILKSWTFDFNFNYQTKNFKAEYNISEDWEKYFSINKENLKDYDLKYLKINFVSLNKNIKHEKIKISKLNFSFKNYVYLVKTIAGIKAYSRNICMNNYPDLSNNSSDFNLNKNTKKLNLKLIKNSEFNTFKKEDSDNDWISNLKDNCKNIYNPQQKDSDGDWIWDKCSDVDSDWIIWEKDNCPYIYNPNQKDINRNNVWDKCEFDKDKDWIFDKLDNCINTPNPEQLDKDKDNIWDKCDNSIYYNPRQIDKNNNWIWDITEEKEKYLKENDDDKDWIINNKDNCKKIANSNQIDTDKDWIWDLCDNCKNYQNTNQLDENKNWIWDICEDSDWDWIEWIKDNCLNIANSDQKDSDNDWVWDACEDSDWDKILFFNDNCPYNYNPLQSDIDWDWVWDICDKNDDRFLESNKWIFLIILSIIIAIFWFAIFKMAKKLK